MQQFHTDDIRPIALVGHRASGKTSLADALLHTAHATERLGSVDDGTSVSDYDDEEHKHHFSIDTSVMHIEHAGHQIHLLDTPGYPDFVGAALEALYAVETAVVVISAANGIEVNTRRMFEEAGRHGLARMIVINKVDADQVDLPMLVETIRDSFGKQCVLFNAPDGVGPEFTRVVNVINPPADIPKGCPIDVRAMRQHTIEAVIEADEGLMERYLTDGDIAFEHLEVFIPKALEAGTLVPIFCICAKNERGVSELLDALSNYTLPPSHARLRYAALAETQFEPSEKSHFLGQVFKTVNDKFVGHLSFIRIISGKMEAHQPLLNRRTGKSTRIGQMLMFQGKNHQVVNEAFAGDIVAVTKVDGLHIGDTVAFEAEAPQLPEPEFPKPMFGLAVEPKNRGDEQKISLGLHKLAEEDPTFTVTQDPQTHEMVINGVSQLHLDVIRERLKKRFSLEINTKEPKIPYRETISGEGAADHRHKKQSGGRGQFGEVHIRIYPLSRDIHTKEQLEAEFANKTNFEKMRGCSYDPEANFAFIDHIVGGTIPNQFIPAVEKGCRDLLERGAIAGYRLQDIAVEVHFGKDHPVDSSEAAFRTAGRIALKKAILSARPVLLEPVVRLEVTAPTKFTGAILGDLTVRRAHVEDQVSLPGDMTTVIAKAPLSEVTKYAAQLGGMTQGQGSYTMEFSHYAHTPAQVQQQIISKAQLAADEDE